MFTDLIGSSFHQYDVGAYIAIRSGDQPLLDPLGATSLENHRGGDSGGNSHDYMKARDLVSGYGVETLKLIPTR
jgi:hypothetical protein